jgi:hypothetical protein
MYSLQSWYILLVTFVSVAASNIIFSGTGETKGIWKQGPEANIWAKKDENGSGEGPTVRNFIVYTVHLK